MERIRSRIVEEIVSAVLTVIYHISCVFLFVPRAAIKLAQRLYISFFGINLKSKVIITTTRVESLDCYYPHASPNGAHSPGGAHHRRHVRHRPLDRPRPLPVGLQAHPLREKRERAGATQVGAHLGGQEWNSIASLVLNRLAFSQQSWIMQRSRISKNRFLHPHLCNSLHGIPPSRSTGRTTTITLPVTIPMDVSDATSIGPKCSEILDVYGRVDVVISNASVFPRGHATNVEMKTYRKIMEINFFGSVAVVKSKKSYHTPNMYQLPSISNQLQGVPFARGPGLG